MLLKQPYLEPYHGPASRHTCPACRKPRCFTRYLDGNTGRPIHPTVGRCNHEIHCGYHYPPRQYFADHPELSSASPNRHPQSSSKPASPKGHQQASSKPSSANSHLQSSSEHLSPNGHQHSSSKPEPQNLRLQSSSKPASPKGHPESSSKPEPLHISAPVHLPKGILNPAPLRKPPERLDLIPLQYLIDSASFNSNFVRFLCDYFPRERIEEAMELYALGATRDRKVIFWQMDVNGHVRTGKMMQYDPQTGKRLRNRHGSIDWVHSCLKRRHRLPADFNLRQCYFGEHLLRRYPERPVALVEGEKTAVIGSMIYRDFIWLAAGNL
ncbi:MAG TPA: DUF6371 domain-containing protein, partial [Proteiniphilum sp.]|nr:DUF6371 domain-containing protein [Proteiniphilum sp.]